jgi:DNA-binding transcriptional regulator YhcF (GntR family)
MSISHLSVKQLERAVELLKEREMLQSKLATVNRDLKRLENSGISVHATREAPRVVNNPKHGKRRRRRKNLQESVIEVLRNAGGKSLTVNEIVSLAKVKPSSLRVWLYTKAKNVAGFKKVAPGTFALAA